MIVLSASNLTKAYGVDTILEKVSFHVNGGDRIGIIGDNGAGKTTLMNILAGELPFEEGEFFLSSGLTLGHLKQSGDFFSENTVYREVLRIFEPMIEMEKTLGDLSLEIAEKSSAGLPVEGLLHRYDLLQAEFERKDGYNYKSEIQGVLSSMAFGEDFYEKKISTLSGGEKTRLALARLLLQKPDLLLLDEPTNHLDLGTLKWLEQYLKSYSGTLLLISHDRYFLDQTVTKIFEIENHKLYVYEGSYSTFAEKKRKRRESEFKLYEKQQTEIARQEEIIRRFKQHNTEHLTKRALSREKMLAKMELVEKPEALRGRIKIHFKQNFQSGTDVLLGENLKKGFGSGTLRRELFKNVNFDIKRGEKICILGPNGIGKTTLLKIIMQALPPDGGYLKVGHHVVFGYYDQEQALLRGKNTLLEELKDAYRLYSDTEMRSILGRFLFQKDQVFLPIEALSGGERARLSLLKLMLSGANVLILDEPTNHLDIASREVFEDALKDFPGTVIAVSHDRYFLNKIPDRIFELGPEGIETYLGSYDYYTEKRNSIDSGKEYLNALRGASAPGSAAASGPGVGSESEAGNLSQAALQRKLNKEKEGERRRLEREEKQLEEDIAALEDRKTEIEAALCNEENHTDYLLLEELDREHKTVQEDMDLKYERWMEVHLCLAEWEIN